MLIYVNNSRLQYVERYTNVNIYLSNINKIILTFV